jgi:hypothetical protein
LAVIICFLIYKWKKNKQKCENAIPNEENRYDHENLVMPKPAYNQGQEKIPSNLSPIHRQMPENVNVYNHGAEVIPIASNGMSSLQNMDNDALQQLKNEMLQTLRQEFMQNLGQQNNGQASNFRNNY